MKLSLKYLFLLFLPIIFYSFIRSNKNNFFQNSYKKNYNNQGIIGVWKTKNNDLKVEVFEVNGTIYGRLVDFLCNHKEKLPLIDHKDVKNPDPKYRNRSWLNTIVLFGLKKMVAINLAEVLFMISIMEKLIMLLLRLIII